MEPIDPPIKISPDKIVELSISFLADQSNKTKVAQYKEGIIVHTEIIDRDRMFSISTIEEGIE